MLKMSENQLSMFAALLGQKGGKSTSPQKCRASVKNGALGGRPLRPILNPDGVSVHGCNFIYAPQGQAGEYAPLACNPYRGCGHGCMYCYVPLVLKMNRQEFDSGATPRINFNENLTKDARKYQALGITEQVMLSFTTDPYHPGETSLTTATIQTLVDHGLGFCTLTKGGKRALRDLAMFRRDRDAFATTLTSLDDRFSLQWEPHATPSSERIRVLKKFHEAGIFTWVSLEPTLSTESSLEIVRQTHEYVDLFKVGRVNYLGLTQSTDWGNYTHRMMDLMNLLEIKHYFKHDLQSFLPSEYENPMRIPQHH